MTAVLFDNHLAGEGLLLRRPCGIIVAEQASEVEEALAALERAVLVEGLHGAGFFSYELGYVFEPVLCGLMPEGRKVPLLWFALFEPDHVRALEGEEIAAWLEQQARGERADMSAPRLSLSRAGYAEKFARVAALLAAGDIYQLNLTLLARFQAWGAPAALYGRLRRQQKVAHGAFVETDRFAILSLSPELFFELKDGWLASRPMKGTAPRGRFAAEDEALRQRLREDEKCRAENLMITDLMRHDLGRLALPGRVQVEELFAVETYETLHQMTSTVRARVPENLALGRLVRALFPAGSIIGAPKIRAQQIIAALEDGPRGVYTGAIGHIWPAPRGCGGFQARFNVAIRTLTLHRKGGEDLEGVIGLGGGIVADSNCQAEWEEAALKMRFLGEDSPDFELIETLKYEFGGGFVLLERHLARLAESARYFGFPCDRGRIKQALEACARNHEEEPDRALRVRLLLDRKGKIRITAALIAEPDENTSGLRYVISPRRTCSQNRFLYHKTTNRAFYDEERERLARETGCDEVLFENEHGELTEGSRSNLFVALGGRLLTPPLAAGLLPGTLRAELLACSKAREEPLTRADLEKASKVYLGNSVRGLQPAFALCRLET